MEKFTEYVLNESLNYSTVKALLENPYRYARVGLPSLKSDALDFGSYLHAVVLNQPLNGFYLSEVDKLDLRTKEGKAVKAELDEKGLVFISKEWQDIAKDICEIHSGLFADWLKNGEAEASRYAEIDGIKCKCRCDYIANDNSVIYDLKFVKDASANEFSKMVANFKYYIQAAFYLRVTGAKRFIFIAIEKDAPYIAGLYELTPETLAFGNDKINQAFEIWRNLDVYRIENYTSKDNFDGVGTITLPAYEFYK